MLHGKFGKVMLEIYKNKKVFITGHTGFKGTWLGVLLKNLGANCAGYSLEPNTIPSHFNLLDSLNTSIIGDINNSQKLKSEIEKFNPEIVFHLAAQPLVRESYKNPINTYQTNVIGTLNLLEAVKECKSVKSVVIITTDKVYENKEWCFPYRENDELGGYDIYSSSKACVEILVNSFRRSFFESNNILFATARAGNVIGGGDWSSDRLIPDIIKATSKKQITNIRSPNSIRPWQHVLDCLFGYLLLGEKLLEGKKEFAEEWNFAPNSIETMSVREIAKVANSIWSDISVEYSSLQNEFHEANILKLDSTKSNSTLGWIPIWNTEKAVEKTIEWYKAYYLNNEVQTEKQVKEYLISYGIY